MQLDRFSVNPYWGAFAYTWAIITSHVLVHLLPLFCSYNVIFWWHCVCLVDPFGLCDWLCIGTLFPPLAHVGWMSLPPLAQFHLIFPWVKAFWAGTLSNIHKALGYYLENWTLVARSGGGGGWTIFQKRICRCKFFFLLLNLFQNVLLD